jgi:hypothetical protein
MSFDADGYPDLQTLYDASPSEELHSWDITEIGDEPILAAFRSSAIATIEAFAGQRFAEELATTRNISGADEEKLYLPKRLASLTSLSIANSAIDETNVAIGSSSEIPEGMNDYLYIEPSSLGSWVTRALTDDRRRVFAAGVNNLAVTGTWGWPEADFPDAIAQALRFDMEDQAAAARHGLGGSIAALRTLGASGSSQGPLSVTISRSAPILSDRAMALVESYVWSSHGAVV